jgi:hypothetical protein
MMLLESIIEKCAEYNVRLLYLGQTGSRLFGAEVDDSDYDYMGIFVPSERSMLLKTDPSNITITLDVQSDTDVEGKTDITLYSVQEFFRLVRRGDVGAIDLLFAPSNEDATLYMDASGEPLDTSKLVMRNLTPMVGYVQTQTEKYNERAVKYRVVEAALKVFSAIPPAQQVLPLYRSRRLPALIETINLRVKLDDISPYVSIWTDPAGVEYLNVLGTKLSNTAIVSNHVGVLTKMEGQYGERVKQAANVGEDYKAMYHAARVSNEALELHETGQLVFPSKHAEYYKKIRAGQVTTEQLGKVLAANYKKLMQYESGELVSKLPETIDNQYIDDLVVSLYITG